MAAIDVGPPTFTNRTFTTTVNGTNFSTAMRLYMWDDNFGGIADEDGEILFTAPSGIHNQSALAIASPTIDTAHLRMNLHMLNPLGYNNQIITQVLLDFLRDQVHVGCGVARLSPTGDGATQQWTPTGANAWSTLDEPMDAPNLGDGINTAGAGNACQLTFPDLPSNVYRVQEAIVSFFGAMSKGPSGSDEGLGFGFQYQSALGNLSRKLIADMYANGSINAQRTKLDRINSGGLQLTGTQFNAGWLSLTAERGTAGPSPNPVWAVYTLEMVVYYEINEAAYEVIDNTSFTGLDGTYTTHLLDFDLIDTTGYAGLLDILSHAPELFLYIGHNGKLKLGRIGPYSAVGSPRALSTADGSITEVKRGPYNVDERYANAVELRWGVEITASINATADPVNGVPDRGSRKYRRGAAGIPVAGWEDTKPLDRHFIRRDSNKDVAEAVAAMYLHLWGTKKGGPKGIDLVCPYRCIDVEPGDVVTVTVPNLGLAAKNFLCVDSSIDLGKGQVLLTVYDVESTL